MKKEIIILVLIILIVISVILICEENTISLKLETSPKIEFRNVSFKYEGRDKYILKNINFVIKSGEKVAIIGAGANYNHVDLINQLNKNSTFTFILSFKLVTFNSILYFLSMLLYFYFIVYIVVLIFLYYEREILTQEENNCDSRTDCIGQEPPCDSDSKEK